MVKKEGSEEKKILQQEIKEEEIKEENENINNNEAKDINQITEKVVEDKGQDLIKSEEKIEKIEEKVAEQINENDSNKNKNYLIKYKNLNDIRSEQCPFLLRIFCREGSHHSLLEFGVGIAPIDDEIPIYAWKNTTLGELSLLLKHKYSKVIEKDDVVSFKVIYFEHSKSQYTAKDAGAVIYGRRTVDEDKTLDELKFFIGDFLSVAILPPQPLMPVHAVNPIKPPRNGKPNTVRGHRLANGERPVKMIRRGKDFGISARDRHYSPQR